MPCSCSHLTSPPSLPPPPLPSSPSHIFPGISRAQGTLSRQRLLLRGAVLRPETCVPLMHLKLHYLFVLTTSGLNSLTSSKRSSIATALSRLPTIQALRNNLKPGTQMTRDKTLEIRADKKGVRLQTINIDPACQRAYCLRWHFLSQRLTIGVSSIRLHRWSVGPEKCEKLPDLATAGCPTDCSVVKSFDWPCADSWLALFCAEMAFTFTRTSSTT